MILGVHHSQGYRGKSELLTERRLVTVTSGSHFLRKDFLFLLSLTSPNPNGDLRDQRLLLKATCLTKLSPSGLVKSFLQGPGAIPNWRCIQTSFLL